jgi:uncharacterized protein (DUF2141 family)
MVEDKKWKYLLKVRTLPTEIIYLSHFHFMKSSIFLILILLGQLAFAQNHKLTITVDGMRNLNGRIQLFLYNQAEDHLITEKAYKAFQIEVDGPEVSKTLQNIPAGEYSLGLFHDENQDAICNLNFLGIPREGYGFSQNYKIFLRAPNFEETKFKVAGDTYLRISVTYFRGL